MDLTQIIYWAVPVAASVNFAIGALAGIGWVASSVRGNERLTDYLLNKKIRVYRY